jgi:multiple sugar transport system ATP-binding protein
MAHFSIDASAAETEETRELAREAGAGDDTQIGVEAGKAMVVGRFGARSTVQPGTPIEAVVDTRALHFFDSETGIGIYDSTKGATA